MCSVNSSTYQKAVDIIDLVNPAAPVIGLLINCLIQIASFRAFNKIGLLKSVFVGFFFGLLGLLVIEYFVFVQAADKSYVLLSGVSNLIAYGALGYCYFHFVNLSETARRIRIMREIYDSDTGLTGDEILKRYNAKEIIDKRLIRLFDNSQVIEKDGKLYIGKPALLLISKLISGMKSFLLGKDSEFD